MTRQPFDFEFFLRAQAEVYADVLAELGRGQKTSHWIWFVFPQLAALGRSRTARFYGLFNPQEARAYREHPVLGARLVECCSLLLAVKGRSAHEILGSPDDLKVCSSMTLFDAAAPGEPIFREVLLRFYGGERDALTLSLLQPPVAGVQPAHD